MATEAPLTYARRFDPPRAEPQQPSIELKDDHLDVVVQRCVDDHAQALLAVLADAGAGWDATDGERRLLTTLVGAHRTTSRRTAPR